MTEISRGNSSLRKEMNDKFLYPLYILCLTVVYPFYIRCIYTVRILFDVGSLGGLLQNA